MTRKFKLHSIEDEIKINIFKYVDYPLNLALTCQNWSVIAKDPYAKTEWLIVHYGKVHALFHAVRLGPTFIDIPLCQILFARKVILSRYFIQRLLMHFGQYDEKLIQLKIKHNAILTDVERAFVQKMKLWASNLPIPVYTHLLMEGYKQFGSEVQHSGYDMESFLLTDDAPGEHLKDIQDIENLILNKRFTPFPPRPKSLQLDSNSDPHIYQQSISEESEEYPSKDGYENNRQLNVIARAILVHPDLVNLWKQIGYYEICDDVNDLVIQGALLILFPPTPAPDWSCPTIDTVISRLTELRDLGFDLKDNVIIDALHMFEHRLDEIGDILWKAFLVVRSGELNTVNFFREALKHAINFFREAFKPERSLKEDFLLKFLKKKFDLHKLPVKHIMKHVVNQYFKEENMSDITLRRKSLILSPKVYQYILLAYGNTELASMCFEDILILRNYIDLTRGLEVPEMSTCTYDSITSTFDLYIKEKVSFEPKYLNILQKATSTEINNPLFNDFLPSVFGMSTTYNLFKGSKPSGQKKQKLVKRFLNKLKQINSLNQEELSNNFRESFVNFRKRLEKETPYRIIEENNNNSDQQRYDDNSLNDSLVNY